MSNFKEFESFKKCLRYLRKQGVEPQKGSNEYKNIKMLFEKMGESDYAVGILRAMCLCGEVGDQGRLMCVKRDSEDYKKWTQTGEVPTIQCEKCSQLAMYLIKNYGFDSDQLGKVMKLVWSIKKGEDVEDA